jgi:hypothetical protein
LEVSLVSVIGLKKLIEQSLFLRPAKVRPAVNIKIRHNAGAQLNGGNE